MLRLRLEPVALRMLLSATVLEVSLRSFYFSNFANGYERKRLSAFTGKFPSSTAGLHLVLNTSCLRKKITVSPLSFGRKFSCDNDQRETLVLYCRCEQYCIVLPSRNKSFLETLSSFCIFGKALFLDPRDSRLDPRTFRGSRIESRVSSVNLILSGTVQNWTVYMNKEH